MCVALLRAVNAVLFISLLMPSTIGTSTGIITEAVNDADIQCLGASVNSRSECFVFVEAPCTSMLGSGTMVNCALRMYSRGMRGCLS